MHKTRNLLIVGSVWPEPNSSAAGQRVIQLIELFHSEGWHISFACSASESKYGADLSRWDIQRVPVEINSSDFDHFIDDLQPAIVMFDRFIIEEQFGWRVAEQCPDALRILDTEDLHCLRRTRKKALNTDHGFNEEDLLREDVAKREIASILRCDLSLIISEYEMNLLQDFFNVDESLLHYLPFLYEKITEEQVAAWPGFEERKHFLTIGNFRHAPNRDAVRYLSESIWPLIRRQVPGAQLHIYGAYPSKRMFELNHPETGFYIKGRANDAGDVVQQARVMLAPLRFGAGLKGKLVEAMQCGTPSVTTSIGAEGIAGEMQWSGRVADSPETIADAAVTLYTDKPTWETAKQQGKQIINKRFMKKEFTPLLINKIQRVRNKLKFHRLHNFTGAMLMHHTAASTKYMGRWIESKNRFKDLD